MPPDVVRDLARLTATAGERVAALEDIGTDLAALGGAVDALAAAIAMMATKEEVEEVEARQNHKRVLLGAGVLAAFLLLAASAGFGFFLLRDLDTTTDEVSETGDYLVECTTPSPPPELALDEDDRVHECFEMSQARTAAAIQSLTLATLDANYCAEVVEPAAMDVCFADRVEARTGVRPAIPSENP